MIRKVRCPGSYEYVNAHSPIVGPGRAGCPVCGRVTSFHKTTGRFARHSYVKTNTGVDR